VLKLTTDRHSHTTSLRLQSFLSSVTGTKEGNWKILYFTQLDHSTDKQPKFHQNQTMPSCKSHIYRQTQNMFILVFCTQVQTAETPRTLNSNSNSSSVWTEL